MNEEMLEYQNDVEVVGEMNRACAQLNSLMPRFFKFFSRSNREARLVKTGRSQRKDKAKIRSYLNFLNTSIIQHDLGWKFGLQIDKIILKSNQQIENPTEIIANQIEIEIHNEEELQQCTDADMIIFKEFGIVSDHTFQELRTINPVAAPSLYKAKKARKNIDEMFKINIKKNGINELYILNIITEIANRKL